VREAIDASSVTDPTTVFVVRVEKQGISADEGSHLLLCLGSGALTWFTVKWIDTYLWPVLHKKLDASSTRLVDYLCSKARELSTIVKNKGKEKDE